MQRLLFFLWVATAGFATAFLPSHNAKRCLPPRDESCHCLHAVAHTKASRTKRVAATKPLPAVTVDSSTSVEPSSSDTSSSTSAIETSLSDAITATTTTTATPYLDTPATTLVSLFPSLGHLSQAELEDLMRKIINGIILAISFGFVIYAIVGVDSGITRGWTQSVSLCCANAKMGIVRTREFHLTLYSCR